MTTHRGFAAITAIIILAALVALGGGGYVAMHPEVLKPKNDMQQMDDGKQTAPGDHPEEDQPAGSGMSANADASISWKFSEAGESDGIPRTAVMLVVNGAMQEVGTFQGSCSEVGASGGIDSKGLLAGELSAAQCWYAGGGDEIGVFANEDGGLEVMVGKLDEGAEGGAGMFRGDFEIKSSIDL